MELEAADDWQIPAARMQAVSAADFLTYTPISPCRVVDTREQGGQFAAGDSRNFDLRGSVSAQGGNAAGCTSPVGEPGAVHINVIVLPTGSGHLQVRPFNTASPVAALLSFKAGGQNIANAAIVKTCVNCTDDITVAVNAGAAHVIIDVLGYFAPNIAPLGEVDKNYVYSPVAPCRLVDTRSVAGALDPGEERSYSVYGSVAAQGGAAGGCSAPRGEPRAVHLELTAVPEAGTGAGNFAAFAADASQTAGGITFFRESGQNVVNTAIVKTRYDTASSAEIKVRSNNGHAHLVIDVRGYYYANDDPDPPPGRDQFFVPVDPCRIVDTRQVGGVLTANAARAYLAYGSVASQGGSASGCAAPLGEPQGVHVNVTAVPSVGQGNLSVDGIDATIGAASAINYSAASQNVANAITARSGSGGVTAPDLRVHNRYGETHLVMDVMGYFYGTSAVAPDAGASDTGGAVDAGSAPDTASAPDVGAATDTAAASDAGGSPDSASAADAAAAPDVGGLADTGGSSDSSGGPDTGGFSDDAAADDAALPAEEDAAVVPPCPDKDHDSYTSASCGGDDCDDNNPFVHPGSAEVCRDGIDQDCDGEDLPCADGEMVSACAAFKTTGSLPAWAFGVAAVMFALRRRAR